METGTFFKIDPKADVQVSGNHKLIYITSKWYAVKHGDTKSLIQDVNLVKELKEVTDPIKVVGVKYKFGLMSNTINQICKNTNQECQINVELQEECLPGERNVYNLKHRLARITHSDYMPVADPGNDLSVIEESYKPKTWLAKFRAWISRYIY